MLMSEPSHAGVSGMALDIFASFVRQVFALASPIVAAAGHGAGSRCIAAVWHCSSLVRCLSSCSAPASGPCWVALQGVTVLTLRCSPACAWRDICTIQRFISAGLPGIRLVPSACSAIPKQGALLTTARDTKAWIRTRCPGLAALRVSSLRGQLWHLCCGCV